MDYFITNDSKNRLNLCWWKGNYIRFICSTQQATHPITSICLRHVPVEVERRKRQDSKGKQEAKGRKVHCNTAGCGRQSGRRKTEKLDRECSLAAVSWQRTNAKSVRALCQKTLPLIFLLIKRDLANVFCSVFLIYNFPFILMKKWYILKYINRWLGIGWWFVFYSSQ